MTPKILAVLKSIALGDEKLGHSLISVGYFGIENLIIFYIFFIVTVCSQRYGKIFVFDIWGLQEDVDGAWYIPWGFQSIDKKKFSWQELGY